MGSPVLIDPTRICRTKTKRLRGKQLEMCTSAQQLRILNETIRGAEMSTKECQYQFRNRRWNCSTEKRSLKQLLVRDTRETAFANAITAAGVTVAIAQACSMGDLNLACQCGKPRKTEANLDWTWGGCSDNVEYGYQRAKDFLDSPKPRKKTRGDVKTLVLRHNNEAGRLAVKKYLRRDCKCHGLSGSCTLKTCWEKVPYFREVGNRLKEKFDGAAKVIPGNDGKSFVPEGRTIKFPDKEDLIYTEDSPDFCETNRSTGSLGTRGRECNNTSIGVDGCELLCCDRGSKKYTIRERSHCKCQFTWCCSVSCETCNITKTIYRCL